MIKKTVFDEIGYFNENYKIVMDLDMWFRVLKKYSFGCVEKPLYQYRQHPENLTALEENKKTTVYESMEVYSWAMNEFEIDEMVHGLKEKCQTPFEKICEYSHRSLVIAHTLSQGTKTCFSDAISLGFAQKSLQINNNFIPAYQFICQFFEKTEELSKVKQYQEIIKKKNEELNALKKELKIALNTRKNNKAEEIKSSICTFSPYTPSLYKELADLYLESGLPEESKNFLLIAESIS
ncbi:MAG: hypothetical protein HQK84_12350 [Nitrospinae bacterium]|nr:hypothetical protein [Nitrospinota bacterium]